MGYTSILRQIRLNLVCKHHDHYIPSTAKVLGVEEQLVAEKIVEELLDRLIAELEELGLSLQRC